MGMKNKDYLLILTFILVIIGSIMGFGYNMFANTGLVPWLAVEGFLSSGKYPLSVDQPLLYNDYLVNKNPGASAISASQQYVDYPVFPASSCGTNNLRYWRRPTNGQCSRADMCGGLYMNTKQKIPPPPVAPKWGAGLRVNYFDTCMFNDRS